MIGADRRPYLQLLLLPPAFRGSILQALVYQVVARARCTASSVASLPSR